MRAYRVLRALGIASLIGFCTLSALGQQGSSRPAEKPASHTLLWKIEGPAGTAPSYLFGTMHVLCEADAVLSEGLQQAIRQSSRVFFEVDMDNLGQMLSAFRYLRMKDGLTLADLLSPDDYQRLQDYLKSQGIPLTLFSRFKPFVLAALLGEQAFDCEKKNGMEMQILKEAKSQDKKVMGLETLEFQAGLFDSIPYQDQARDLLKYIDSAAQYAHSTRQMAAVYREENLERLESLMIDSDPGMQGYMELLVYGRNRRWVEQMSSLIQASPCLFAVGAGHLPGEQGVIKLLRQKGYTVSPLKNW